MTIYWKRKKIEILNQIWNHELFFEVREHLFDTRTSFKSLKANFEKLEYILKTENKNKISYFFKTWTKFGTLNFGKCKQILKFRIFRNFSIIFQKVKIILKLEKTRKALFSKFQTFSEIANFFWKHEQNFITLNIFWKPETIWKFQRFVEIGTNFENV